MKKVVLALLRVYQLTFAALFGGQCRFQPSCSQYAREAIEVHGVVMGSRLALTRIAKCGPFDLFHNRIQRAAFWFVSAFAVRTYQSVRLRFHGPQQTKNPSRWLGSERGRGGRSFQGEYDPVPQKAALWHGAPRCNCCKD